ncbi:NADH dehydrogenase [ubiquinone] 1 alpha subcomplex subunit 11 [Culicoides brevitarsis]|uniref:NADH dehydrogenase [ubiquinone] 1 alpha subcomplex subunit 11 n=1 Tax=Culicoides brevitarsis TaxID=469753 RepID=UPI00307BF728
MALSDTFGKRSTSWLYRQYYDKPDGEDLMGKMIATNRYAVVVGYCYSTIDCLLFSHTKGYMQTIGRFAKFTLPLMGIASTFTVLTFASNRLREKDDTFNYMVGATAAGAVAGAAMKNTQVGFACIIAFCAAGWAKRLSLEEGWLFFPPKEHKIYGDWRVADRDWSLREEGERGWTR